jgi:hypothetical protein
MVNQTPTLVSCERDDEGGDIYTFHRTEEATNTLTTITLRFWENYITLTVDDMWETRSTYQTIDKFQKEIIDIDIIEDDEKVFEERGMYTRFLSKITSIGEYLCYDVDIDLCNFVRSYVQTYIDLYTNTMARKIQAHVRGWIARRRFNIQRMRVMNELSVLPPRYIIESFPGGNQYRMAMNHWIMGHPITSGSS